MAQPLSLGLDDLRARPRQAQTTMLDCTGGWYSAQTWAGVPLGALLAETDPLPEAASVTVRAVSGYARRFTLDEVDRLSRALEVAGTPLNHGHGFPARLVAPDPRGSHWVKWVSAIEVNRTPAALQPPLPLS